MDQLLACLTTAERGKKHSGLELFFENAFGKGGPRKTRASNLERAKLNGKND